MRANDFEAIKEPTSDKNEPMLDGCGFIPDAMLLDLVDRMGKAQVRPTLSFLRYLRSHETAALRAASPASRQLRAHEGRAAAVTSASVEPTGGGTAQRSSTVTPRRRSHSPHIVNKFGCKGTQRPTHQLGTQRPQTC